MNSFLNWEQFWQEWRNKEAANEEDLFFQVGLTVDKKPIEKEAFDEICDSISDALALNSSDILAELCCGNGLITCVLKDRVRHIYATDFAAHLIKAAKEFKSAPNITYICNNVFDFLEYIKDTVASAPTKYLMSNALAYFTPDDLKRILLLIMDITAGQPFLFYLKGVPNDKLKWNFYNTEERRQKYLHNMSDGNFTNDGMGRWWHPEEIAAICQELNLKSEFWNSEQQLTGFRMDIKLSRD